MNRIKPRTYLGGLGLPVHLRLIVVIVGAVILILLRIVAVGGSCLAICFWCSSLLGHGGCRLFITVVRVLLRVFAVVLLGASLGRAVDLWLSLLLGV